MDRASNGGLELPMLVAKVGRRARPFVLYNARSFLTRDE